MFSVQKRALSEIQIAITTIRNRHFLVFIQRLVQLKMALVRQFNFVILAIFSENSLDNKSHHLNFVFW